MKLYDISVGITSTMPVWPGDPRVELEQTQSIQAGDGANVTRINCSVHTGTHIDAPSHFIDGGRNVDQIPLKTLIGRAFVVQLEDVAVITASDLVGAGIPEDASRVLFRTRNSRYWQRGDSEFHEDFVALDPTAAQWLVDRGVQLVGVDYLSVAPYKDPAPTHVILLKAGVVVVEGLNLTGISPGSYTLFCLPLKIEGVEGSLARAILQGD